MAAALKDLFSEAYLRRVSERISQVIPSFWVGGFEQDVFSDDWKHYQLKQRYHHMARCLRAQLASDYPKLIDQLIAIAAHLQASKMDIVGLEHIFIPTVIELYGNGNLLDSVRGMEHITELASCEFAVRQFFVSDTEQMLSIATAWCHHPNPHVRRLASEGARPALPWGRALKAFKADPRALMPLLTKLKDDPSLYVRKSVANHLNDISKTHPELVTQTAKQWKGTSKASDWIIKHACRTLLKAGNTEILPVFGYQKPDHLSLENMTCSDDVAAGDQLHFGFEVTNRANAPQKLRLEYAIGFLRKNGQHNQKVFMIRDQDILANQTISIHKKHSFRPISTRVYYPGAQYLLLKVNGVEWIKKTFELGGFELGS